MRAALLLVAAVLASGAAAPLGAQSTTTGFKTGEYVSGMTKQCLYDALGNQYTLTIRATEICPLNVRVTLPPNQAPRYNTPAPPPPEPTAINAYKTGERTSGLTKQCFYEALGNTYTKTISSVEICPLSVRVRP